MIRAPVAANACFWSASGQFGCGAPAAISQRKEGFVASAVVKPPAQQPQAQRH